MFKFQIGDSCDVNAYHTPNRGWKLGFINAVNDNYPNCGQIQIQIPSVNPKKAYDLYWIHLDNKMEIAPPNTHTNTNIISSSPKMNIRKKKKKNKYNKNYHSSIHNLEAHKPHYHNNHSNNYNNEQFMSKTPKPFDRNRKRKKSKGNTAKRRGSDLIRRQKTNEIVKQLQAVKDEQDKMKKKKKINIEIKINIINIINIKIIIIIII